VGDAAADERSREMFAGAIEEIRTIDPHNPALGFTMLQGEEGYAGDIDLDIRRDSGYGNSGVVKKGNDMALTIGSNDYYISLAEIYVHEANHVRDVSDSYELFLLWKYFMNTSPRYFIIGHMLSEAAAFTEEFMYRRRSNEYYSRPDSYPVYTRYGADSPKPDMDECSHPLEYYRHLEEWYKAQPAAADKEAMYRMVYSDFFADFIHCPKYLDDYLNQAYGMYAMRVALNMPRYDFMLNDTYRDMHSKDVAQILIDAYIRKRLPQGLERRVTAAGLDLALDGALQNMYEGDRAGFWGKVSLAGADRVYLEHIAKYKASIENRENGEEKALSAVTNSVPAQRPPFGIADGPFTAQEITGLRSMLARP
jgi:hypothetical protein